MLNYSNIQDVITDEDFYQYPDLETFREKLEELRNFDFTGFDPHKISETIFSYLTVIPSLSSNYNPDSFNTFKFYRARLNIDHNTEDERLIRTYSYPPPSACAQNGRANLKNRSVFYSSNSALTAIIESKPKADDIGYLSVWNGFTDREIKCGVLLPRDLTQENEWYVLAKDIYAYAALQHDQGLVRRNGFFHEALDFISSLFLTEKIPYSITSWIATELLYGTAWKDFIIYPSVANNAYSSNIVFHPNVADQYLKFEKVIRFKVLKFDEPNISLSVGKVGELFQNNIKWRDATEEEMDFASFPGYSTEVTCIKNN